MFNQDFAHRQYPYFQPTLGAERRARRLREVVKP